MKTDWFLTYPNVPKTGILINHQGFLQLTRRDKYGRKEN